MKKIALLISLVLLALTMFGCSGKTPPGPDVTGAVNSDTDNNAQTNEDLYDKNGYLKDSIPAGLDYEAQTVRVMGWNSAEASYDFNTDYSKGDEIAEQTYIRNKSVEERLNINLEIDATREGSNNVRTEYITSVENALRTGEPYDMIACYSQCAANFAADGFLRDLNEFDNVLDFSKPWWSKSLQEGTTINNKLYFASGSISAAGILQTFVLSVNMSKIYQNDQFTDPRELVLDGTWTMEEFYSICKDAYLNTNMEVDGKDAGDTFGYIGMDSVVVDAFLASNGLKYLSTDTDGKLVIAPEFRGTRIYDLTNELSSYFKSDDFYSPSTYSFDIFTEGRSIFAGVSFHVLMQNRAKFKDPYGYLPFPKADTNQQQYYTTSGFPYSMWMITTNCEEIERAAYVMEALASAGYRTVQPKIYDQLKYRGTDDPLNAQMFDLIVSCKTYDMGRIFVNEFVWADSPVALFRQRLNNSFENWYSELGSKTGSMQGVLDRINTRFGY